MNKIIVMIIVLCGYASAQEEHQLLSIGKHIVLGSTVNEVAAVTKSLGIPERTFSRCYRNAGCVDDISEVEANRLFVSWQGSDDTSLGITFCKVDRVWQVATVIVIKDNPKDDWGNAVEPTWLLKAHEAKIVRFCR